MRSNTCSMTSDRTLEGAGSFQIRLEQKYFRKYSYDMWQADSYGKTTQYAGLGRYCGSGYSCCCAHLSAKTPCYCHSNSSSRLLDLQMVYRPKDGTRQLALFIFSIFHFSERLLCTLTKEKKERTCHRQDYRIIVLCQSCFGSFRQCRPESRRSDSQGHLYLWRYLLEPFLLSGSSHFRSRQSVNRLFHIAAVP